MQSSWSDTIIALATPPGVGAIGVIRLSGSDAVKAVNELFPSKNLDQQPSHTLHVGMMREGEKKLDEVVVSLYRAPKSYTGEDVVEISCHGSPFVQQQVIEACMRKGVRLAKPGEFTQRAFLNGKLDLAQAEAVADLILSNTEASQRTALHQMRGGFSQALKDLREELIRFSALIELELDFSQEDVEFADRTQFLNLINSALQTTYTLKESFRIGNAVRNGVSVALVGKPNAGKSTLLNALLNEERAIVSEIAGTTRDTIEEILNIEGILFRLIDTAGIREHTSDLIESAGIERTHEKIRQSDLVIYLFDVREIEGKELEEAEKKLIDQKVQYLLVGNKSDLVKSPPEYQTQKSVIFISAKSRQAIEDLRMAMKNVVLKDEIRSENVMITNARHYQALEQMHQSLLEVKEGLTNQIPGDLLALDIRRSLHYIGEITGEVTNEDQLDYIFSKFCIGK